MEGMLVWSEITVVCLGYGTVFNTSLNLTPATVPLEDQEPEKDKDWELSKIGMKMYKTQLTVILI